MIPEINECEACLAPDTCRLRGSCEHYSASKLRVASCTAQCERCDRQAAEVERLQSALDANWVQHQEIVAAREGIGRLLALLRDAREDIHDHAHYIMGEADSLELLRRIDAALAEHKGKA